MGKKIRRVIGYGIELIYWIDKKAFPDYCRIKGHISSEPKISSIKKTLVIELINIIIDYTLFRKFDNKANVLKMAINPSFQNKVYGKIFILRFLHNLPKETSVFLDAKGTNNVAIKLYKKVGIEQFSKRYRYYSDGIHAIIMRLIKQIKSYGLVQAKR